MIGLAGGWLGLRLTRRFRWGLGVRAHWILIGVAVIGVATLPFDGQGYPDTRPWRIVACQPSEESAVGATQICGPPR